MLAALAEDNNLNPVVVPAMTREELDAAEKCVGKTVGTQKELECYTSMRPR